MSELMRKLDPFGLRDEVKSEEQLRAYLAKSTICAQEALRHHSPSKNLEGILSSHSIVPLHPGTLSEVHREIYAPVVAAEHAGRFIEWANDPTHMEHQLAKWYGDAAFNTAMAGIREDPEVALHTIALAHTKLWATERFPFGNERCAILSLHAQMEATVGELAFPSRDHCSDYLEAMKEVTCHESPRPLREWMAKSIAYGKQMLTESLTCSVEQLRQARNLDLTRER